MYEQATTSRVSSGQAGTTLSGSKSALATVPELVEELHKLSTGLQITTGNIADALGGSQPSPEKSNEISETSVLSSLRTIRNTLAAALNNADRARGILNI